MRTNSHCPSHRKARVLIVAIAVATIAQVTGARPAQAPLYRDLGLNDREIAIIATATAKRHYYLKSPRGSRLFELGLGHAALAFLTAAPGLSMEETSRRIDELIAAHGLDWPAAWLDERGLASWATRVRQHRPSSGDTPYADHLALPIAP